MKQEDEMATAVAEMAQERVVSVMKLVADRVYYTNTGQDYRTYVLLFPV